MASSTSTTCALSSPSTLADGKAPPTRQLQSAAPNCISLPSLPPPHSSSQSSTKNPFRGSSKAAAASFCRRIARNVVAMATAGESIATTGELPAAEGTTTELPEILKTVQNAWDGLEDKYAVTSLAVAGVVALWATTGMVSAIDRLPIVPGVLELVGIGYTGWFAYRNLVFKPDREALVARIKSTYSEIIGSN